MANNYTQFSFAIGGLTAVETAWIRGYLDLARFVADDTKKLELNATQKQDAFLREASENGYIGFEYRVDDGSLWIYAEESGSPDHAVAFVQRFLKANRPKSYVTFTWASTCSKMRVDEFDGGGAVITATSYTFINSSAWCEKQAAKLAKRGLKAA